MPLTSLRTGLGRTRTNPPIGGCFCPVVPHAAIRSVRGQVSANICSMFSLKTPLKADTLSQVSAQLSRGHFPESVRPARQFAFLCIFTGVLSQTRRHADTFWALSADNRRTLSAKCPPSSACVYLWKTLGHRVEPTHWVMAGPLWHVSPGVGLAAWETPRVHPA